MRQLILLLVLLAACVPPTQPADPLDACRTLATRRHLGSPLVHLADGQCEFFLTTMDRTNGTWLPLR